MPRKPPVKKTLMESIPVEPVKSLESLLARLRARLSVTLSTAPTVTVPIADFDEALEFMERMTTLEVMAIDYAKGKPLDISLKPPKWFFRMLVETLAAQLHGESGKPALNYSTIEAYHDKYGLLELVIQRKHRDTPVSQLVTAERLLRKVLEIGTGPNTVWGEVKAFLDRPSTEEPHA